MQSNVNGEGCFEHLNEWLIYNSIPTWIITIKMVLFMMINVTLVLMITSLTPMMMIMLQTLFKVAGMTTITMSLMIMITA